jgi:SRSO17 transposase
VAGRPDEANDQSLQHFLSNSPRDPTPVRRQSARRMRNVIRPTAWVIDDTGFVKDGRTSPRVARQYTGTAGKVTNCQVATTPHLTTDQESRPIDRRPSMPESRDPTTGRAAPDTDRRRRAAGIPEHEHHRPKWTPAPERVDETLSRGTPAPPVPAADTGHGDNPTFRH